MTGAESGLSPAQPHQDPPPIVLPRYPAAANEAPAFLWALPEPPVSPRLIIRWLAAPVARVVAVASAAGWLAATGIFVWTLASGHPLSAVTAVRPLIDLGLLAVDIGICLLLLGRIPSAPDMPPRETRRAARRAQKVAARSLGARATLRRWLRRLWLPAAVANVPRPLRELLAGGFWDHGAGQYLAGSGCHSKRVWRWRR